MYLIFTGSDSQNVVDTVFGELLKDLECPVCYEYMIPPITQCYNGHNICSRISCGRNLQQCPLCRGDICNVRNRAAENLSRKITHPCSYRQFGCMAQYVLHCQNVHEECCRFKPHKCPLTMLENCNNWSGPLSQMKKHIKVNHPNIVDRYCNETIQIKLCDVQPLFCKSQNKYWCRVIFGMGEVFFFYGKLSCFSLDMCIMQVIPKGENVSFKYSITLANSYYAQEITSTHLCLNYNTFINQLFPNIPVKGVSFSVMYGFVLECLNDDNSITVKAQISRS